MKKKSTVAHYTTPNCSLSFNDPVPLIREQKTERRDLAANILLCVGDGPFRPFLMIILKMAGSGPMAEQSASISNRCEEQNTSHTKSFEKEKQEDRIVSCAPHGAIYHGFSVSGNRSTCLKSGQMHLG